MSCFVLFSRSDLRRIIDAQDSSVHIRNLATTMLLGFNKHFGSGEDGTVAVEHRTRGGRMRPKGVPLYTLLASLLDPRFKVGVGLSDGDQEILWEEIRDEMIVSARVAADSGPVNLNQDMDVVAEAIPDDDDRDAGQNQHGREFNIYEMINELVNPMQVADAAQGNDAQDQDVEQMVDAEIILYKAEPMMKIQDDDGSFPNPLDWWRRKQDKFPILATMAAKYLAIPATSAPSERVFSVAGLTIRNQRANLDPYGAGDIVFLHDALPAYRRFNAL